MNNNIRKLSRIAAAKSRTAIGLMSGTSLDGLDIVLCRISGSGPSTRVVIRKFVTIPYTTEERSRILAVFAKEEIEFRAFCELNAWIGVLHGTMINKTLKRWKVSPANVDFIASHGQTVFHAPMAITPGSTQNSTLQAGDGDHVAVATGIITLSDFRQKHVAAGGEGAPLAVYGDYLLFSKKDEERVLLNIGGIGNFTWLNGNVKKVFVTDTGPGNTLLDQAVRHFHPGMSFDKDASFASKGIVNAELLQALKNNDFFKLPFPKTTGPEQFNLAWVRNVQQASGTTVISFEDLLATLTRLSAETIAEAIRKMSGSRKRVRIFTSGGGAHNPLLLGWIRELLPGIVISPVAELGIDGDAKEAVLFAVLGNEALAGGKTDFGKRAKVPSVSMGKVSFPK
jgi:anhydro-N-acetylmuramic acid kinase